MIAMRAMCLLEGRDAELEYERGRLDGGRRQPTEQNDPARPCHGQVPPSVLIGRHRRWAPTGVSARLHELVHAITEKERFGRLPTCLDRSFCAQQKRTQICCSILLVENDLVLSDSQSRLKLRVRSILANVDRRPCASRRRCRRTVRRARFELSLRIPALPYSPPTHCRFSP